MKKIINFSVNTDFPKFSGHISFTRDTIKYDSSVIIISNTDIEVKRIFELGLVFPDLIYGASTMGDKFKFKSTFSTDSIFISDVSELHFPNQGLDTKCYSFLLWNKNAINPSLYLFQITNKSASSNNKTKTFIEKAKVTAFGFCSILI